MSIVNQNQRVYREKSTLADSLPSYGIAVKF